MKKRGNRTDCYWYLLIIFALMRTRALMQKLSTLSKDWL